MTVQPDLCQTWSEPKNCWFLHAQAYLMLNFTLQGNIVIPALTGATVLPNQATNQTPVKVQTTSVPEVSSPPLLNLPTPNTVTSTVPPAALSPDSPTPASLKEELLQLPPVSETSIGFFKDSLFYVFSNLEGLC